MAGHRSATVRGAAVRSSAISFANSCFDRLSHTGHFVAGEIIHHHRVAWPERRHEGVGHIGLEART